MEMDIYWMRGYMQAKFHPKNGLGREESGRENSHEYVKVGSNYRKTAAIQCEATGETEVNTNIYTLQ